MIAYLIFVASSFYFSPLIDVFTLLYIILVMIMFIYSSKFKKGNIKCIESMLKLICDKQ